MINKVVTLAEDLGLKESEAELTTLSAEQKALTDTVTTSDHTNLVMNNDPEMLSTDDVLTKRDFNQILYNVYTPVAIEQSKKDTRIYMYIGFGGHPQVELLRQQNQIIYSGKAIVDEQNGDSKVVSSDRRFFINSY